MHDVLDHSGLRILYHLFCLLKITKRDDLLPAPVSSKRNLKEETTDGQSNRSSSYPDGGVFALIILHLPITFSLCIATGACMIYCKIPLMTLIQNYSASINSFTLMAIPFFVLAGEIMGSGGISDRLLKTADACVGHIRGGLAHVNVLALCCSDPCPALLWQMFPLWAPLRCP